ncbi:MAG: hypothetical protein ACM3WU_09385 [Bacillota bacterium]
MVEAASFRPKRVLTIVAVAIILAMLMLVSSCTERAPLQAGDPSTPNTEPGGSKQATPSGATEPAKPAESADPVKPAKPFGGWDSSTTIPFLCYATDKSNPANELCYLGLWDIEKGTVSFQDDPLFSVARHRGFPSWDGQNRFAFDHEDVTQLHPGIRVEKVRSDGVLGSTWASILIAPSGSNAIFAVYEQDGVPVLEIRNHPMAGKIPMELPELAPGTRVRRAVGIEIDDSQVNVYFETHRPEPDGSVLGLVVASYLPASPNKTVMWRILHPQVPSFIAGSGTAYSHVRDGMILSSPGRETVIFDLNSRKVGPLPGLSEALLEDDMSVRAVDIPDSWWEYRDYRIGIVQRCRQSSEDEVDRIYCFKDGILVGRIEFGGNGLMVYKDDQLTCEAARPGPWLDFPRSVLPPVKHGHVHGPGGSETYTAMWLNARYADLFAEPLFTDGWLSEQISVILMDRFKADRIGFVRALALATTKQAEMVGDCLAYIAHYGDVAAFRDEVESLKEALTDEGETGVVDALLKRIDLSRERRAGSGS